MEFHDENSIRQNTIHHSYNHLITSSKRTSNSCSSNTLSLAIKKITLDEHYAKRDKEQVRMQETDPDQRDSKLPLYITNSICSNTPLNQITSALNTPNSLFPNAFPSLFEDKASLIKNNTDIKQRGSLFNSNQNNRHHRHSQHHNQKRASILPRPRRNSILRNNRTLTKSASVLHPDALKALQSVCNEKTLGVNSKFIKIVDIILAFIVSANIVLAMIDNELYFRETKTYLNDLLKSVPDSVVDLTILSKLGNRTITPHENTIRWINIILIIIMIIFIGVHYILQMKKMQQDGIIASYEGIWASGLIKYFLLETIIIAWFSPPSTNIFFVGTMDDYYYGFSFGGVVSIITMFKSYLIIRVYSYISKWTTETAKRICNSNSVKSGVHFALKADLKHRPYYMLTLVFGSVIISFALALRTFEYFTFSKGTTTGPIKGSGLEEDHLKDLVNSVWMTIVTMTTVGYGDYVPKENYGRVISVVSCIIGLLLVSIIVVSLEMITEFSEEEKKAYSIIKKINADQNVILKATDVIVAFSILRIRSMRKEIKLSERFVYIMKLKQSIMIFKDNFRMAKSMDLPLDQTLTLIQKKISEKYTGLSDNIIKLECLKESVDNVNHSQKKCIEIMAKVYERQERLGNFLVKMNNERLMNSLRIFEQSNYKHHSFVSNIKETRTYNQHYTEGLIPPSSKVTLKAHYTQDSIDEEEEE